MFFFSVTLLIIFGVLFLFLFSIRIELSFLLISPAEFINNLFLNSSWLFSFCKVFNFDIFVDLVWWFLYLWLLSSSSIKYLLLFSTLIFTVVGLFLLLFTLFILLYFENGISNVFELLFTSDKLYWLFDFILGKVTSFFLFELLSSEVFWLFDGFDAIDEKWKWLNVLLLYFGFKLASCGDFILDFCVGMYL